MADPEGVYIFHTRRPRFLAKVENNVFEIIDDIDNVVNYFNGDLTKLEGLKQSV